MTDERGESGVGGTSDARMAHGEPIPEDQDFRASRATWREALGDDEGLHGQAMDLQVAADRYRYTYTWDWLGVPIIRLPDDILVLQELVWSHRPDCIIETGVARGGSLLLNASLQRLAGTDPRVLGIDIQILPHTSQALQSHPLGQGVEMLEADSTSRQAHDAAAAFLTGSRQAVLILDSNHTHDHVLAELRSLAPLLPVGSLVLVADTLIEEFPAGYHANRPWDRGNNPATAVREFLGNDKDFELAPDWCRRALVSEFRDGILRRVG